MLWAIDEAYSLLLKLLLLLFAVLTVLGDFSNGSDVAGAIMGDALVYYGDIIGLFMVFIKPSSSLSY